MWDYSDRNKQKYYVNPKEWHLTHFSGGGHGMGEEKKGR